MLNSLLTLVQQQFDLQIDRTLVPLHPYPSPASQESRLWQRVDWGRDRVHPHSNDRTRSESVVSQILFSLDHTLDFSLFSGSPFEVDAQLGEVLYWSHWSEQVEWQERIEQGHRPASHTCTSCHYLNRESRPAVICALHPCQIDIALHEPNPCQDWQGLDLSPALATLEQALTLHPATWSQDWTIVRLVYPPGRSLWALEQVERERQQWRWQPDGQWVYGGKCWMNLGEMEQFGVWCHPNLSVPLQLGSESSVRQQQ